MQIQDIVQFNDDRFFEGAVQLSWLEKRPEQAHLAAESFVFHGPRYHGASQSQDGIDNNYRLKDTASFVRDLLSSMVDEGQSRNDENPFRLVVAGYGSGKSHLALTCASLLTNPTSETTKRVLAHLSQADEVIGENVRGDLDKLRKPALVVPLDGMSGFHLGNALSQAIFKQLDLLNIDADPIRLLSPRFNTAIQFVERNFNFRQDSFNELLPGISQDIIRQRLNEHDEQIYEVVDTIFTQANGQPIPVEGQESAQDLIDVLSQVYCGPDGPFSYIVILFDEFGRYLEYAGERPNLAGDAALQQMFQGIQDNRDKIRFVGFIQYELKAYLRRFQGAGLRQLQRYITRFDAAEKWYLSTNLETIFAHMIHKDESALDMLWQQSEASQQYQRTHSLIASVLPSFARYPVWQNLDRFSEVIGRGCWPLHPLTVWFLTRQKDVVQSRSALTFIKEMISQFANKLVLNNQHINQIRIADLVLDSAMLEELIAAEKEVGGSIAETLQGLLNKLSGHLTSAQQLVLAGCAALEKMRIGNQSQITANNLLHEATGLVDFEVTNALDALSELGALEWNRDLGQYELLTDGASRGQFQQWIRVQSHGFDRNIGRNLYMRWALREQYLPAISTDFAQSKNIATPDWRFEPSFAHTGNLTIAIQQAFKDWADVQSPNDAKGRVLYLYFDNDDNFEQLEQLIKSSFENELARYEVDCAPIWIIAVHDQRASMIEYLINLYIFQEKISDVDRERFRRFIPDEINRCEIGLKQSIDTALKQRQFWVAGFKQAPSGRLKKAGEEIFQAIYTYVIPFPVDGFATTNGTAKADCAQLMRGLIARQVDGSWVQTQRRSLHNRVHTLMSQSWGAMNSTGKVVAPQIGSPKAVFEMLMQVHQEQPERTLYESYLQLIRPPYGMNSASAGLMLSLLVAVDNPPRRLTYQGSLISSSDWVGVAFSSKGNELQEVSLKKTTVRFLAENSADRWRSLLEKWDLTKSYAELVNFANEARNMLRIEDIPESLEGSLRYLQDKSDKARGELENCKTQLSELELNLEKAEQRNDLVLALWSSKKLYNLKEDLECSGFWPESYIREASKLLCIGKELVGNQIEQWIPRQNCTSFATLTDFRSKMDSSIRSLSLIGFEKYASALQFQVNSSIQRIEHLQQYNETLAQCKDYPRQPAPSATTSVQELRDNFSKGEQLISILQQASNTLTQSEIDSYVIAIRERQKLLKDDLQRKLDLMGSLYKKPSSEQELRELAQQAKQLQKIFIGTKDEADISEIIYQIEYIQRSLAGWPFNDVSASRLREILKLQSIQQAQACILDLESKDIEPAWCIETVYEQLADERVKYVECLSHEWIFSRLDLKSQLPEMELEDCLAVKGELDQAPIYLTDSDRSQVRELIDLVTTRIALLQERIFRLENAAWIRTFTDIVNIKALDSRETERQLIRIKAPPHELNPDEELIIEKLEQELQSHLDQLSIDGIVYRISKLPYEKQIAVIKIVEETLLSR